MFVYIYMRAARYWTFWSLWSYNTTLAVHACCGCSTEERKM